MGSKIDGIGARKNVEQQGRGQTVVTERAICTKHVPSPKDHAVAMADTGACGDELAIDQRAPVGRGLEEELPW